MYRIPSTLVNLSALLALAGCAQATGPAAGGDGGTEEPDASVGLPVDGGAGADAATQLPDAAPVGPVGDHLLITEVVLQPTEAEFVEIYNPTDAAVALDDYYLADVPSYYLVPAGQQVVASSDFVVRFPAGASLGARQVAVVSVAPAADFTGTYGVGPDYSVGAGTTPMRAVNVGTAPTLTNAGENIILFQWDGSSDLVKDVNLIEAGKPTGSNLLVDKSGVQVTGPTPTPLPPPTAPTPSPRPRRVARPARGC